MLTRLVRRLGRSVRSRVDGAPPPATLLAQAHHETRTRVEQIEAAHGVTAGKLKALEDAHHLTAMKAAEAVALAETAGRDSAAVAAHLPTLLAVISSHNSAARELKRAHDRDERDLANLSQWLQDLGNTVTAGHDQMRASQEATSRGFSEFDERMTRMEARAEAIRHEVLFEARYGSGGARTGATEVDTHVVRPERIPDDGPLHLNLGSGLLVLDDHVNVDARELDGVDVVADVRKLPFDPDTVDTVRSAHLLEHFPVEELRRTILPHWYSLLRPGGVIRTIVPDGETMISEFAAGRMSFDDLRLVTFGEQDYDGDFHFTMFDVGSLRDLLGEAGFVDVETVATGRRNGLCYEMEIVARKPSATTSR
jgi:hypothetical protein